MYRLAVIGDKDSISSFKVLGLDIYPVEENLKADEFAIKVKKIIEFLVSNNYGIIYITEECAKECMEVINRYKAQTLPIITLIPSNSGSHNIGMSNIDDNIEKAIGTNIF
ncbi:V-type ATP synthase subunit F [Oceanivirga salmonicida]|uniref:V-type ATP synthase subunit F n=1 Tax=Oceanivirga salmonicida TaxID=1769291 RepID=UPI00082B1B17|nr:V-type ATP synthase subunit F [Oceanivirga salmonicida]